MHFITTWWDENIFKAVLNAIASFDKNIKLMILSSSKNEAYEHIKIIFYKFDIWSIW